MSEIFADREVEIAMNWLRRSQDGTPSCPYVIFVEEKKTNKRRRKVEIKNKIEEFERIFAGPCVPPYF